MDITRRKFSREFKIEAVRLVTDRGVAVAQAARDLDVAESVLRRWMRELVPSIQFEMKPLSRKHPSGTARRSIRASFSEKPPTWTAAACRFPIQVQPPAPGPRRSVMPVLLNLSQQKGLIAQGKRTRRGDLPRCCG